jgi:hypothetical protein
MRSESACHATTSSRSEFGADAPRWNRFRAIAAGLPVLSTVVTTGDPHNRMHST